MKWYKVDGLNPGGPFIKKVKVGNKNICLVGYEGKTIALSAKCPHAGGDLTMGRCNNNKIVCPIHRYSYDLQTGKGSNGQNDFIDTYPVKIINEEIYVGVMSVFEKFANLFGK